MVLAFKCVCLILVIMIRKLLKMLYGNWEHIYCTFHDLSRITRQAVCEEEFAFGPSCPQHSSHLNRIIAVVSMPVELAPGSVLMI